MLTVVHTILTTKLGLFRVEDSFSLEETRHVLVLTSLSPFKSEPHKWLAFLQMQVHIKRIADLEKDGKLMEVIW